MPEQELPWYRRVSHRISQPKHYDIIDGFSWICLLLCTCPTMYGCDAWVGVYYGRWYMAKADNRGMAYPSCLHLWWFEVYVGSTENSTLPDFLGGWEHYTSWQIYSTLVVYGTSSHVIIPSCVTHQSPQPWPEGSHPGQWQEARQVGIVKQSMHNWAPHPAMLNGLVLYIKFNY